jgi:hypothetical protein
MPRPKKYASDAEKQAAYRARQAERVQAAIEGRRPAAPALGNIPPEQRWKALLQDAQRTLETLRDEMQAYFDDRSEQWQESERGEALQERIEEIESMLEAISGEES